MTICSSWGILPSSSSVAAVCWEVGSWGCFTSAWSSHYSFEEGSSSQFSSKSVNSHDQGVSWSLIHTPRLASSLSVMCVSSFKFMRSLRNHAYREYLVSAGKPLLLNEQPKVSPKTKQATKVTPLGPKGSWSDTVFSTHPQTCSSWYLQ